ncbi:MAG: TRAM domain-containing protein [archaeon]
MFQERRRFAPVKEGDELDVRIEALGEKGDGIAKTQGFVLFVPKTKAGDEVRIRVTRVLKNAGFAEVLGQATGVRNDRPAKPAKKKEEEEDFQPATENDSEDFGEESGDVSSPEEESKAVETETVEEEEF